MPRGRTRKLSVGKPHTRRVQVILDLEYWCAQPDPLLLEDLTELFAKRLREGALHIGSRTLNTGFVVSLREVLPPEYTPIFVRKAKR